MLQPAFQKKIESHKMDKIKIKAEEHKRVKAIKYVRYINKNKKQ